MRQFQAGKGTIAALSFTLNGKSLVCIEADGKEHLHRAVQLPTAWLSANRLLVMLRALLPPVSEEVWMAPPWPNPPLPPWWPALPAPPEPP